MPFVRFSCHVVRRLITVVGCASFFLFRSSANFSALQLGWGVLALCCCLVPGASRHKATRWNMSRRRIRQRRRHRTRIRGLIHTCTHSSNTRKRGDNYGDLVGDTGGTYMLPRVFGRPSYMTKEEVHGQPVTSVRVHRAGSSGGRLRALLLVLVLIVLFAALLFTAVSPKSSTLIPCFC